MTDFEEIIKRILKYLVEGILVAICAYTIPQKKINLDEVVVIGLWAAAVFCLLDTFSPAIGSSARNGAGMGIGFNLVGFPKMG
jgi:hypothetical protein